MSINKKSISAPWNPIPIRSTNTIGYHGNMSKARSIHIQIARNWLSIPVALKAISGCLHVSIVDRVIFVGPILRSSWGHPQVNIGHLKDMWRSYQGHLGFYKGDNRKVANSELQYQSWIWIGTPYIEVIWKVILGSYWGHQRVILGQVKVALRLT